MVSIIIPTLNEAKNLAATIAHLRRASEQGPVELIVSDCNSSDGSAALARSLGAKAVVQGARCRADALNRGASCARGDVLLFVHADTLLERGFVRRIERALRDENIVGGAFDFAFADDPRTRPWQRRQLDFVILVNRCRFRLTGNFYGDQAIFVRRHIFDRIGGFPNLRLLEDVGFCRQMRRLGRTAILQPPVLTSPRRFLSRGVTRQLIQDMIILGCDNLGLAPEIMWDGYQQWNRACAPSVKAAGGLA